jgi:hypothetical protein
MAVAAITGTPRSTAACYAAGGIMPYALEQVASTSSPGRRTEEVSVE